MGDYWFKGVKNPNAGKPFRHTRDKIDLVLDGANYRELYAVITKLADKYPVEVLSVLVGDDG